MTYRYTKPPSQRQLRVAEEIRHAIAQMIVNGELNHPYFESLMISVSEVRISPDLKLATAFMIYPDNSDQKALNKLFNELAAVIRKHISGKIALRYTPKIRFAVDESVKNAAKIESLFSKIHKNPS